MYTLNDFGWGGGGEKLHVDSFSRVWDVLEGL